MLAFLVSLPMLVLGDGPAIAAVPVGIALVLIGFLVLLTRRSALSQLIGFLILDNGIATTAFLTSGGVPLVVELGVSLDVLLVVLILRVLTARHAAPTRGHRPRRPDGAARLMGSSPCCRSPSASCWPWAPGGARRRGLRRLRRGRGVGVRPGLRARAGPRRARRTDPDGGWAASCASMHSRRAC